MAISSLIEWDVQSVGSDNNGGGFKAGATGTDYSTVGATPQATLTTLSVVGASTSDIMVSTVDYTVAATDVGNTVQITGGTATAGFYEIQSITTGITGVQKWTVDRATGAAAATIVGAMGGSLATPQKIMAEATALVAGQTIHIKNATYTRTTTISLGASGTVAAGGITCKGYNTAHNDITSWAGMANAPVLTSATANIHIITTNGKTGWNFSALQLTSTGSPRGSGIHGATAGFFGTMDLMFLSTLNGVNVSANAGDLIVSRTEAKGCTSMGLNFGSAGGATINNCWIHGSTSQGISAANRTTIMKSVIDHNNTGNSANLGGVTCASVVWLMVADSTIALNTGSNSDGIIFTTAGPTSYYGIANSILYGNGRYNLNVANSGLSRDIFFNAWGGAGTANTNAAAGTVTTGGNVITLTVDPFTNSAANGDFSLNTAGAEYALLKAKGFPGAFPGGTMTGYADVGPLQHQDTGAGATLARLPGGVSGVG